MADVVAGAQLPDTEVGAGPPRTRAPGYEPPHQVIDQVVVRFAGDSGDGMQLTGDRFKERKKNIKQSKEKEKRIML